MTSDQSLKLRKCSLKAAALAALTIAGPVITRPLLYEFLAGQSRSHICEAQAQAPKKKTWAIQQILSERKLRIKDIKNPRYCNGGAFEPCVCASDVTKLVQYRPSVRECKKNAAIIFSGRYLNAYSVVVRDFENKDRWPPEGINGCSAYERDVLGLNRCSAFKVQNVIPVEDKRADAEVHCLGASGYSALFKRVRRITIKLQDIPGSNLDPLEKLCLIGPDRPLN